MKPILIGAVIAGSLIALVLLIFQSGLDNDSDDGAGDTGSVETFFEIPLEDIGDHPGSSIPDANFSGVGIGFSTADPEFLINQLEMAGVEVPEGATTAELMDLVSANLGDGFIALAP